MAISVQCLSVVSESNNQQEFESSRVRRVCGWMEGGKGNSNPNLDCKAHFNSSGVAMKAGIKTNCRSRGSINSPVFYRIEAPMEG